MSFEEWEREMLEALSGRHHVEAEVAELDGARTVRASRIGLELLMIGRLYPPGFTHWGMEDMLHRRGVMASHTGIGAVRNSLMRAGYIIPTGRFVKERLGAKNEVWQVLPRWWLDSHTPKELALGQKRPDPHEHMQGSSVLNPAVRLWEGRCIHCGLLMQYAPPRKNA